MLAFIIIFAVFPFSLVIAYLIYIGLNRGMTFLNKKRNKGKEQKNNEETFDLDDESDEERIPVYNKIIEKAKEEAQAIKEAGLKKINLITQEVEKETSEKINLAIEQEKKKNEEIKRTKIASLEQMGKQLNLANHKKLIQETINKAYDELLKLDDESLKSYVLKYMKNANLNSDVFIVVNNSEFIRYQRLFSSAHNEKLDKLAKILNVSYKLTLKETTKFLGGFIIVGPYFDIDNSYQAILKGLNEEIETDLANLLFACEE